jgi:hypothetical protein
VRITDGWEASGTAIARVVPQAQHRRCRCHALHAASRPLRPTLADWSEHRLWAGTLWQVFQTTEQRTVQHRLKTRQPQAADTPVAGVVARLAAKLPPLLPAGGSTLRRATSHAAEHFFAAVARFSRRTGPCQNRAAAEKPVALLLLGDVFRVRSAAAHDA